MSGSKNPTHLVSDLYDWSLELGGHWAAGVIAPLAHVARTSPDFPISSEGGKEGRQQR